MFENEDKYKIMAAILNKEFNYSQRKIANLMNVQQSTISTWVRIGVELLKNKALEQEVKLLRENIKKLGYNPQKNLEPNIIEIL